MKYKCSNEEKENVKDIFRLVLKKEWLQNYTEHKWNKKWNTRQNLAVKYKNLQ